MHPPTFYHLRMYQFQTQFRLDRNDYTQLLISRPGPLWRGVILVLMPIVGLPLLLFGSLGIYFRWGHASPGWMSVAIFGFVLVLARPLLIWVELQRQYDVAEEVEIFVQDENIEVRTSEKTSQYNWSDFTHFGSTTKHFILFSPSDAPILPKRAFSADEHAALSSILWRNLPDRAPTSHSGR